MTIVLESGPLKGVEMDLIWSEKGYRGLLAGSAGWIVDSDDEPTLGNYCRDKYEALKWLDDRLHELA